MHFAVNMFKKIIEFNLFKTFMKKKNNYITPDSTRKIKQMSCTNLKKIFFNYL